MTNIKVSGAGLSDMAKARTFSQTEIHSWASMTTERLKVWVTTPGPTVTLTKENLWMVVKMVMVFGKRAGITPTSIKASTSMIESTAGASFLGQVVAGTKAITRMIPKAAMVK